MKKLLKPKKITKKEQKEIDKFVKTSYAQANKKLARYGIKI